MNKYDKIFVPDPECPAYIIPIKDKDGTPLMEHEGPVIVLSIEEALEMWNAGRRRASDELGAENLSKVTAPDFYTYLASKNIQL